VNLLSRHGSREPTNAKTVSKFIERTAVVRQLGNLTKIERFKWLKDYTCPYGLDSAGELTDAGLKELYDMGLRFGNKYRKLFDHYDPMLHKASCTQIDRAAMSGASFTAALWDHKPIALMSATKDNDRLLRPFQCCDAYAKISKDNVTFEGDRLFDRLKNQFASDTMDILGIKSADYSIDGELIDSFYSECTYDISAGLGTGRFCSLISDKTFFWIDYIGDTKEYYMKSFPREINWQIAQPLLLDFFNSIEKSIAGKEKSNLRFAHAETVMPFAAILGLQKEEKELTADFTEKQVEERKWKGSLVSPFAANIAMVTYNCSTSTTPRDYRVQLLQNEMPINFPGCADSSLCPFNVLKKLYSSQLAINFDKLCFSTQ